MSRKLLYFCIISVLMLAALMPSIRDVQAQDSPPGITVNATGDWIEVWGLDTDDIPARLEVLRGEGSDLVCSGDYPVIDGNPWLDCPESGIQVGDLVTLQINNVLVNEHIVPYFTIDVFVQENGYFKGNGPVGEIVGIDVCNPDQDCIYRLSTVDQEGIWEYTFVDVSVTPYHFWATIWDGVNSTQANYIPPPTIEVNHTTDWLTAWGFTSEDQSARLEVLSPTSDLKCSGDYDLDGFWDISLDCQMQDANILPGDLVILEVDGQQVNELLIQPIFISEYSPVVGIIRGTAPESAYVQADICNQDGFCTSGEVTMLGSGAWEMYFDPAPFNYVGWVGAHVIEPDGDHSIAEYFHRSMDVNVTGNWISAGGFGTDNQSARLEVLRGEGQDLMCEGDFDLSVGDPWLECWQQDTDILPGDQVLLIVDGAQVKDHTVFDLTLDEVNIDEGYFAGTAPMETTVRVDVCNPPDWDCIYQEYTTWSGSTTWSISFGEGAVDPDAWFGAFVVDDDGDQTMADLYQPEPPSLPVFGVNVTGDWISAWGFGPDDHSARLEVLRGEGQDLMCEGDFDLSEGDPRLECWKQSVDIIPGDEVLLFVDGVEIKDHIVLALTLEEVNLADGYFAGSAPSEATVQVDVCNPPYDDCLSQEYTTWSGFTDWSISFGEGVVDPDAWYGAIIMDEDGDQTMADYSEEPEPYIEVRLPADAVAINLGPEIHTVILEVYSPEESEPKCFGTFTHNNYDEVLLDCWHTLIFPGDTIKLYVNGETEPSRVHQVIDITLDVFNPDLGIFAGTLDNEVMVPAWMFYCNPGPLNEGCFNEDIELGTSTDWVIDLGPDKVSPDAWFAAYAADEDGDVTQANLEFPEPPPLPVISANIALDEVVIYDLGPDPVFFTLEVYAEGDTSAKCAGDFDYLPGQDNPWLECWDVGIDPGDHVYMLVDEQIIRDHLVFDLTIDVIDFANGFISGAATAELFGWMYICNPDDTCFGIDLEVDQDGSWVVDVGSGVIDPAAWFNVNVTEEDGDWTTTEIIQPPEPPMPAFTVQPDHGWVCTGGWQVGEWLTLTIAEDEELNGIIHDDYQPADQSSWNENVGEYCFDFYNKADLIQPGQFVSVAGDELTKDTWIEYLVFDKIDPGTLVASGYGTDGGTGHVYLEMEDGTWFNREITVDSSGDWTADFGGEPLDLESLVEAHVVVWDIDGDETMAHLDVEDPLQSMFGFNPVQEIINAVDWPMGTVLTLEVDNPATSEVDYTDSGDVTGYAPWNPEDTLYVFDTSGYPVLPGYLIKIYGSDIYKQTMVTSLTIDTVDYGNNRVLGSTGSDSFVDVRALGPSPEFYTVLSDQDGYWDVSFSKDLIGFDFILFIEPDEDGDTTELMYFPNSPPVAEDDSYLIDEDNILSESAPGVLANDSDPEGSSLSAVLVEDVQHGVLILNPDGSFSYTPDQDYFGPDSFSYYASDGVWESNEAVVSLIVASVNDPPTAQDDSYSLDEDTVFSEVTAGVLVNDSDPEGSILTATLKSGVEHGSLILNSDGSFSYTPEQDYDGSDSFSYAANDGEKDSLEAVVSLTINAVNDAPQVYAGPDVTLDEGQSFVGIASFSDPDPDIWTATVDYYSDGVSVPDLPINSEKTFSLAYDYPHDNGQYTVTVTVGDGSVLVSDSLTVTINNVAPNVDITSLPDGKDTVLTGLELDLVVSFTDPGDDTHTAVIDWGDGSQVIDPALSPLTVSHVYQTTGIYPITVTVTDDDESAGSAAASLTVVDPAGAAQTAIDELDLILTDPDLDPEIADDLEDAIVELEGANDGASSSGAIDKIDGGQWKAALVKITKAIQDLEEAEDADPTLDFSAEKETLALTAKSVALDVIELAEAAASKPKELAKVQQAYELIVQGQTALASGDFLGAVDKFREAIKSL